MAVTENTIKEGMLSIDIGFDPEKFSENLNKENLIESNLKIEEREDIEPKKIPFHYTKHHQKYFIKADEDLSIRIEGNIFLIIEVSEGKDIDITEESLDTNAIIEIHLKEGTKARYISIQKKSSRSFVTREAYVGKDSAIEFIDLTKNALFRYLDSTATLEGENSKGLHKGAFYGNEKNRYFISIDSNHIAKNTTSDIITRSVLGNSSKALFKGNVGISKDAKGSTGYQKIDTILLDKTSEADAVPNLNINNNNVKCSHGATIGRISEEKIFYLISRGISREEAQNLIIDGFIQPILESIPEKTREMIS